MISSKIHCQDFLVTFSKLKRSHKISKVNHVKKVTRLGLGGDQLHISWISSLQSVNCSLKNIEGDKGESHPQILWSICVDYGFCAVLGSNLGVWSSGPSDASNTMVFTSPSCIELQWADEVTAVTLCSSAQHKSTLMLGVSSLPEPLCYSVGCLLSAPYDALAYIINTSLRNLFPTGIPAHQNFEPSSKNKAGAASCPAKGVSWKAAGLAIAMVPNAHWDHRDVVLTVHPTGWVICVFPCLPASLFLPLKWDYQILPV